LKTTTNSPSDLKYDQSIKIRFHLEDLRRVFKPLWVKIIQTQRTQAQQLTPLNWRNLPGSHQAAGQQPRVTPPILVDLK